ncbi:hypothetical protein [Chthoniobacter flavus]|uniref:hypothetical protein n=1 Tax=Chthoniobacter flavus TaxID=191863 RepID=UPI0005B27BFA|nr:hypothetical protein [Chthoniobacter flavus]
MRDEELVLRFVAFALHGKSSYRTPQKHWLNDAAKKGRKYTPEKIGQVKNLWESALETALAWFEPKECFRRLPPTSKTINRALFDLVMFSAMAVRPGEAAKIRPKVRKRFAELMRNEEFLDLISRAVDHKKRTLRRFEIWSAIMPTRDE